MSLIFKFNNYARRFYRPVTAIFVLLMIANFAALDPVFAVSDTVTNNQDQPNKIQSSLPTQEELELRATMDIQRAKEEQEQQVQSIMRRLEMLNLPGGLSMSKHEVTQGLWRAVLGENPSHFGACGESCPVENVSWNEVQNFIFQLNQKSGRNYRLPSEQEWLTACKAGQASTFCGSTELPTVAWFAENAGDQAHPVGQKQPNAWGLFDMSGNVAEWTKSCQDADCTKRVVCGGSWLTSRTLMSAASCDWLQGGMRNSRLGFRLVLDR